MSQNVFVLAFFVGGLSSFSVKAETFQDKLDEIRETIKMPSAQALSETPKEKSNSFSQIIKDFKNNKEQNNFNLFK